MNWGLWARRLIWAMINEIFSVVRDEALVQAPAAYNYNKTTATTAPEREDAAARHAVWGGAEAARAIGRRAQ